MTFALWRAAMQTFLPQFAFISVHSREKAFEFVFYPCHPWIHSDVVQSVAGCAKCCSKKFMRFWRWAGSANIDV
jgi:hypothetical protein